MDKYLLAVIGAGEGALPILKKTKDIDNVETIVFAPGESVGKKYADYYIDTDIFDVEFIEKVCLERNVNGIIATSECTTEPTAIIANMLNLPGNSIENGFAVRDKYIMRERVAKLKSVKQPHYCLCDNINSIDYPVVVKAADSWGKRGVSLVRNDKELLKAIDYSRLYSSNGRVLIEEYLSGGQEYSIECLAFNDNVDIIQYTEKDSSGPPNFIEIGHHQPANIDEEIKKKINVAICDLVKVLGVRCGMAHVELKVIENEIYFIEMGARGGGDHISDILTIESTGFDYIKAAIDCSLGIYKSDRIYNKACCGIYFHCKQNVDLEKLFQKAKFADWCLYNTIDSEEFTTVSTNDETSKSGYIIYSSDHKITVDDCV